MAIAKGRFKTIPISHNSVYTVEPPHPRHTAVGGKPGNQQHNWDRLRMNKTRESTNGQPSQICEIHLREIGEPSIPTGNSDARDPDAVPTNPLLLYSRRYNEYQQEPESLLRGRSFYALFCGETPSNVHVLPPPPSLAEVSAYHPMNRMD